MSEHSDDGMTMSTPPTPPRSPFTDREWQAYEAAMTSWLQRADGAAGGAQ